MLEVAISAVDNKCLLNHSDGPVDRVLLAFSVVPQTESENDVLHRTRVLVDQVLIW